MARDLSRIIVIDVEATCWAPGQQPADEESEIIEIGVCEWDVASLAALSSESMIVRPMRSRVSPLCTQLTTLTPELVEGGISFEAACEALRTKYHVEQRVWASYGDYDRAQFERQCRTMNVRYPFGTSHLNVKSLFALVRALPREVGMAKALSLLGLELQGTHHRGGDDAQNIARILAVLLARARGVT
jgi:inhibitor of KinA sporulation pathway (predicted exonuclease)